MRFPRRAVRGLAYAGLGLFLAFLALHTPQAKRLVSRLVAAAFDGATIEELDYRLWRGEVELTHVRLERESLTVSAARLEARLSLLNISTVSIVSPDLRVRLGTEDTDGGAFLLPAWLLRWAVEIRDGRFSLTERGAEPLLEVEAIAISLDPEGVGWRGEYQGTGGLVRYAAEEIALGSSRGRFRVSPDALDLEEGRLESDDSFVTARGNVSWEGPFTVDLDLSHRIDLSLLAVDAEGVLSGEGELRSAERLEASGRVRSERVTFSGAEPVSLDAPWALSRDVLRVSGARLEGYGGSARVDARWELATNRQHVDAAFEGIELGPVASRASGTASVSLEELELDSLTGDAEIVLEGLVAGIARGSFERGEVSGTYEARIPDASLLEVPLQVRGEVRANGALEGPVRSVRSRATLGSRALHIEGSPFALDGKVRWSGSELHLEPVTLRDETGTLALRGTVDGEELRLTGRAESLGLAWLSERLGAPVRGAMIGTLTVSGSWDDPDATASLEVQNFAAGTLIDGTIETEFRKVGGALFLDSFRAVEEDAELTATGTYDISGDALAVELAAKGWRLEPIPSLSGTVETLTVALSGPRGAPRGDLSATLGAITYGDVSFDPIRLDATAAGDGALRFRASVSDTGELATGVLGLEEPYPAEVDLVLEALPMGKLIQTSPALVEAETALEPSGIVRLSLSIQDPASLRYRANVDQLIGTYRGIGFGVSSPFVVEGGGESIDVVELTLVGSETAIGVDGRVPLREEGSFDLNVRGTSRLELWQALVPSAELAGGVELDLRVSGQLTDPKLRGDVILDEAAVGWNDLRIDNASARAVWSENALVVERATGDLLEGTLEVEGEIPATGGGDPARLRVRATGIDVARYLDREELLLTLDVDGSIEARDLEPASWRASGRLTVVEAGTPGLVVESEAPSKWELEHGMLRLEEVRLLGSGTELAASGGAKPFGDVLEWSAGFSGRLAHEVLNPFIVDYGMQLSGHTEVELEARWENEQMVLDGSGVFEGARLAVRDPALSFTNLKGRVTFDGQTIRLSDAAAEVGGGSVTAEGTIELSASSPARLDLRGEAREVRVSYPQGLRSRVDGSVQLRGAMDDLLLAGDVTLGRGVFSRNISVESELLRGVSSTPTLSLGPDEARGRVRLDVRVQTDEGLRIDNNLAEMQASVNLTIGGTLETPELRGIVTARSGGRFRFGRNTYRVERARIALDGYPLEPPDLDILARTSVGEYDIRLAVKGKTDALQTEFTELSNQGLTRADIASVLLTGRPVERLSREGREVLGEQMASYLGSTLSDLARLGLGEALPFTIVTVEPALIGREADPAARFTLGAGVTEELSIVYSVGLDDAERQIWIVNYELPRRFRTQLIRQEDNELTGAFAQQLSFDFHKEPSGGEARPIVSSIAIDVEGRATSDLAGELQRSLRLEAGDRFDYWRAWEQTERLRTKLRERGYLGATVDMTTSFSDPEAIDVTYRAEPGPRVSFVWQRDDPGDTLRRRLLQAWDGQFSDRFMAGELESEAMALLFQQRYYSAEVSVDVDAMETEATVTVRIDKGPRGERVEIVFVGNETIPLETLRANLPKASSVEMYELLTVKRPQLKQRLRLAYAEQGFLSASVSDPLTEYDERRRIYRVRIAIEEGPRYNVARIELEGAKSLPGERLRSRIPLREGRPFRVPDFIRGRANLASHYRQQGYFDARVDARMVQEGEDLVARYVVDEGELAIVGDVTVAGNDVTRESLIRREVTLEGGTALRLSDMTETQRRLYDLDIFRSADVVVEDAGPDSNRRDIRIDVAEAPDLDVDYGVRLATDGLFEVTGGLGLPNLFGRAHHASVFARVASDQRSLRFTYHTPYLARYKLDTDFFVERKIITETDFDQSEWTFSAQQGRRLASGLNLQWSYKFERTITEIELEPGFPDIATLDRAILTSGLIGDYRDNIVRPTRGVLWIANLQGAPRALGTDVRFVKFFGQLFAFVPLGKGVVWASAYRFGAADSFGDGLFRDDRFRAGGPSTVRGFELNSLDGIDPETGLGGEGLLLFNQELRFPLYRWLRGAAFYDAGNAFPRAGDTSLSRLRHSAGLGVRVDLPFGLIRLDFAAPLDREPEEDAWQFIFSLGHAF